MRRSAAGPLVPALRLLLAACLAALLAAAAVRAAPAGTGGSARAGSARGRSADSLAQIRRENARPGARRWQLAQASENAIQGYAWPLSVTAGQSLALHVSTRRAYRVLVYRLGWYGGDGARRVACVPSCAGSPAQGRWGGSPHRDRVTGEASARWPVSERIRTRPSWTSGEYLAQLVLAGGPERGRGESVPFVVRPRRQVAGAILVVVPVNTWEAYNSWGSRSLYAFNSRGHQPAVAVSFQRPWSYGDENLIFPVIYEYPMLRFLERSGFPLQYETDLDIDRHPGLLLAHRLSVTLGHSEYWSAVMRVAWDAARDAGRNLAFLGANSGYWQIRYGADRGTIIEYREASRDPDPVPAQKTTAFRALQPPLPECQLMGVEFWGGGIHPPLQGDYTVTNAPNPWLASAGLRPGDILAGAVRGEWDAVKPGCTPTPPEVLFHYAGGAQPADATLSTSPAGGRTLALGSLGFGGLLDSWHEHPCRVDPRAQRFLRAALADLDGLPPARLTPLGRSGCPAGGHAARL